MIGLEFGVSWWRARIFSLPDKNESFVPKREESGRWRLWFMILLCLPVFAMIFPWTEYIFFLK